MIRSRSEVGMKGSGTQRYWRDPCWLVQVESESCGPRLWARRLHYLATPIAGGVTSSVALKADDAKRLKDLERENPTLKRRLAERPPAVCLLTTSLCSPVSIRKGRYAGWRSLAPAMKHAPQGRHLLRLPWVRAGSVSAQIKKARVDRSSEWLRLGSDGGFQRCHGRSPVSRPVPPKSDVDPAITT